MGDLEEVYPEGHIEGSSWGGEGDRLRERNCGGHGVYQLRPWVSSNLPFILKVVPEVTSGMESHVTAALAGGTRRVASRKIAIIVDIRFFWLF